MNRRIEKDSWWSRRKFIQASSVVGLSSLLTPTMLAGSQFRTGRRSQPGLPGKHPDMLILNDRPWNAETPAHLLDEEVTSMDRLFVRNNGLPPNEIDPEKWTLEISGESAVTTETFTLAQLKAEFEHYTYQLVLECGGNGRSEFDPPAKGNQWTTGAVGAPRARVGSC